MSARIIAWPVIWRRPEGIDLARQQAAGAGGNVVALPGAKRAPAAEPNADLSATLAAMDRDIAEFDARARRLRRLLALRATTAAHFRRQKAIAAAERRLLKERAAEEATLAAVRDIFSAPPA